MPDQREEPSSHTLPILRWAPEWRRPGAVRSDLLAGLTGAIIVLPQGVAFATLAGMPPQYGLYAAMVPCIVAAVFGSSRLMITGPANAISLTTMALIAPLAAPFSADYVRLVLTLTFMVGLIQVALGLGRAGRLVDYVPHSVIVGFTAGAAVLIINSQIGPFFGLGLPRGTSFIGSVTLVLERWREVPPNAPVVGLVTLIVLILWQPLNRWIPAMLVGVVAGGAAAWGLDRTVPEWGVVATVESLPGALPPLSLPSFSLDTWTALAGPAAVMTLLALTEATAIARAVAMRSGDGLDTNQEFVGQGLANVAGAFFSAYPASGSFNRSGVNVAAGARTPLAAIVAASLLIVLLAFVGPWARLLPYPAIAALLFMVAWTLIDRREIARIWREEPFERAPLVVTFVAMLTLSLEAAILLGVVIGVAGNWFKRRRKLP